MSVKDKIALQIADGVVGYLKKIGKIELLEEVIRELSNKKEDAKAKIFVPYKLNAKEKQKLVSLVSKIAEQKNLECEFIEDDTLIDGFKMMYKNRLWDFSVSSQLNEVLNK